MKNITNKKSNKYFFTIKSYIDSENKLLSIHYITGDPYRSSLTLTRQPITDRI